METSAWIALVLGIIGLIFFTVMLLPQIYQNWAHKSTGTLSYTTMLLWTLFCVFLAVSLVDSGQTISLIVQANVLGFLTVICLVQIRFYNSPRLAKHPRLLMLLAWESLWVSVVLGGLEYLLVYLCQVARSNGREWLGPAMNVLGNVCVALGYIPQYREIFLAKSCFGVSRLFLMCDILGGLFSIASLAFIAPFDYLAAACYGTIALLTASIFALGCHYGYNPPQNTEQASA
ncbi:uncharacterized protein BJ171DRAFT_430043 [Polychytrium aggregatum]|uniref:uncharacterized protein n=1 Tax=Polychytrium aggregatum TaxID=110093 RepID=UPI0022FDC6CA|nr:uncharacterized protein BJ171DRAFT_430043 [Polychytrium aggregatum]KAI9193412.1 hypothetical protein BJ171DRAFT_430043 [Polychytrium aggregatum]